MGIDVYMRWKDITEVDRKAQITGFDTTAGNVGYLREAYHGEPYATMVLIPKACWDDDASEEGVSVPAAVLREALSETLLVAAARGQKVYNEEYDEGHPALRSFVEFVELAERKEQETGQPIRITVSY